MGATDDLCILLLSRFQMYDSGRLISQRRMGPPHVVTIKPLPQPGSQVRYPCVLLRVGEAVEGGPGRFWLTGCSPVGGEHPDFKAAEKGVIAASNTQANPSQKKLWESDSVGRANSFL
jgi:hypothetical protein